MSSPSSQPFSYQRFDPLNENPLPARDQAASVPISAAQSANKANLPVSDSETRTEVEERRARHLLDRAFAFWEKGDNSGAILACRQSLAIDPNATGAYSMLGLLLERAGDVKGAIEAYDKAVEIAPDSVLERDSAKRLRAANKWGNAAPMFHFEDAELFDTSTNDSAANDSAANDIAANDIAANDIAANDSATSTEPATLPQQTDIAAPAIPQATSQIATRTAPVPANTALSSTRTATPNAATTPIATLPSATPIQAQNVSPRAMTNAAPSANGIAPVATAPVATAPVATAPVATAPVASGTQRASQPVATPAAQVQASAPRATTRPVQSGQAVAPRTTGAEVRTNGQTVVPQTVVPTVPPSVDSGNTFMPASLVANPVTIADGAPGLLATWQSARTFWMRSLPLVAIAGTSFLFLLWSRGVALERERQTVSSVAANNSVPNAAIPNATTTNAAPLQSANGNVATVDATNVGATNNAAMGANTSSTGNNVNGNGASNAQSTSVVSPPAVPSATATPTGLIVNNAPPSPVATKAKTQNATTGRDASRRDESGRERRARRSDNASGEVERAASRFPNPSSPMPDARSVPPASVSGLQRLSNDSGVSSSSSTGALPPVTSAPSGDGGNAPGDSANNQSPSNAGPLPSFPSPADIQSRAQEQMRERASSNVAPSEKPAPKAENTAYQYQTRALIYVEQGNNARAASDFQSAMALYRRQIARGDRVDEAQRGLQACRDGLMLITSS